MTDTEFLQAVSDMRVLQNSARCFEDGADAEDIEEMCRLEDEIDHELERRLGPPRTPDEFREREIMGGPLVGGVADGNRLASDKKRIDLPVLVGIPSDPDADVEYKQESYYSESITVDGRHLYVWRHSNLTMLQVMERLLAGYRDVKPTG